MEREALPVTSAAVVRTSRLSRVTRLARLQTWKSAALVALLAGVVAPVAGVGGAGVAGCSSAQASGSGGASVSSIIFIKRVTTINNGSAPPTIDVAGGNGQVIDYTRYEPGGSLNLLAPARVDGTVTNLTASFPTADFNGADVSFDATSAVFSMKKDANDSYHIYTVSLPPAATGKFEVHQLTAGSQDDFNPIFLPGQQIAFATNQMYTAMGTRADEYEHSRIVSQLATISVSGGDANRFVEGERLGPRVVSLSFVVESGDAQRIGEMKRRGDIETTVESNRLVDLYAGNAVLLHLRTNLGGVAEGMCERRNGISIAQQHDRLCIIDRGADTVPSVTATLRDTSQRLCALDGLIMRGLRCGLFIKTLGGAGFAGVAGIGGSLEQRLDCVDHVVIAPSLALLTLAAYLANTPRL